MRRTPPSPLVWLGLLGALALGACAPPAPAGIDTEIPRQPGPDATGPADSALLPSDAAAAPEPVQPAMGPDAAAAPRDAAARDAEVWPLAGTRVVDFEAPGRGPCAKQTVNHLLASIWARRPELRNAPPLSSRHDDGFVHVTAFTSDAGWKLILERGTGDCPSGCVDRQRWYYATDASCAPHEVGHGRFYWCFNTTRVPAWGIPPGLDPAHVCGADDLPRDISGSYPVAATGVRSACPPQAQADARMSLTMVVRQDPADLGRGSVTIAGTGEPALDGRPLPARFFRRGFVADETNVELPAPCAGRRSVVIEYDFDQPFRQTPDARAHGVLRATWHGDLRCEAAPPGTAACARALDLTLDVAGP